MDHIRHRHRIRMGTDHAAPDLEICLGVRGHGAVNPDSGVALDLKDLKVSLNLIGRLRPMTVWAHR
jgi:hypothetical protein